MGTSTRPDGLPDGYHTGGVWLTPDETEVYKPLTAWPCANATERYPTDEAKCLAEMSGQPGFLPSDAWRVEERNGEQWLVIPRLYFWPQERDVLMRPELEDFLLIESAMKALNAAGWEYNDLPQLAYYQGTPVLVDFSIAHKPSSWGMSHGDEWRMDRWWEKAAERKDIAALRRRGGHVRHAVRCPQFCDKEAEPYNVLDRFYPREEDERREYEYIYASTRRPMSALWGPKEGIVYMRGDEQKRPRVYTWLACDHLLPDDLVKSIELTMAWTPWP
jgi:hypothetical protein